MKRLSFLLTLFLGVFLLGGLNEAKAAGTCSGRFVNPISAPCWDCLFPMTIGKAPIVRSSKGRKDPPNPASPLCFCGTPIPRVGLSWGYWEPARLMDVTMEPFCFPNLGGVKLPVPIGYSGKASYKTPGNAQRYAYHVHYYIYPLLSWMNLLTSFVCLQPETFDIAYITEFDPLWNNDSLAAILNPEVFLFANPVAQLACTADCLKATTTGLPFSGMFWCDGCQGALYPMVGNAAGNYGPLPAANLIADRFLAKMHRMALGQQTRSGSTALCSAKINPWLDKLQYRKQMVYPKAHKDRFACAAMGVSTVPYENLKIVPFKEDLGFIVWRKRNCCAL